MIRTHEWKLVLRVPDGPNELYDLVNDPEENTNRFEDPTCKDVVASLRNQMTAWFHLYVDPEFDGSREAVCGRGQLTSHSFQ